LKCGATLMALTFSYGAARADWQIAPVMDENTDRGVMHALLPARDGDGLLVLECVNGAQLLSLKVTNDLSRGIVESVVTYDERKPKPQLLQVFSDPKSVPLFDISAQVLLRVKRIRIGLQPIDTAAASYDFDTRGAKQAVKAVVCGPKPKSLFRRLRGR
jgi:hypothetical protein